MTKIENTAKGSEAGHTDTADRVLDVAERLVQTHGFNGFSYADIADEVGIRKASLHYHFPTKAALGKALIARYRTTFLDALAAIDRRDDDAAARLRRYAKLYTGVLRKQRMCLCGMLAAEFETLPKPMRKGVVEFFRDNEAWLRRVLDEGRREKTLRFDGPPSAIASFLVSSLEGAMLVARSYGKMSRFDAVVSKLLSDLAR
ncbi:MAG: TetR/AcrR family transcriptional regulator [Deltaproteobacteria bacterium]|nr:TetR/AcrR family transcriptional regulator [Deltaproteobacteria bacterium]